MKIEDNMIVDEHGIDKPMLFKRQDVLKDRKWTLYAWITDRSGNEWDVKIGMAQRESVLDRALRITGSNAENRIVGLWATSTTDGEVHNKLKALAKTTSLFRHANDGNQGGTTTEVYKFQSLAGLRKILETIDGIVGFKHIEKVDVPLYKDIKELVDEISTDNSKKFILDLCPRFGKTRTALELMKVGHRQFNIKISAMLSYVGTAKSSYATEIGTNLQYDSFELVDPDAFGSQEECIAKMQELMQQGKHILYYFALTGSTDDSSVRNSCFKRRLAPLLQLGQVKMDMYVDEADFGADTGRQIDKIHKLWDSYSFTKFYGMTGTDAGCVKKIWPQDALSVYKRDYIMDVLKAGERKEAVSIKWHVLHNESLAEAIDIPAAMENFSAMCDIVDGHLRGETYFRQLLRWLYLNDTPFNPSKHREIANAKTIDPDFATMVFLPNSKECHAAFAKLVEQTIPGAMAIVVNGDETTNAEAEELVKNAIEENARRRGIADDDYRRGMGVFVIASSMANRSFSIKEIKNIMLLINGGEYWSISQKIARGLTPYRDVSLPNDPRKTCHIVDFRLAWQWPMLSSWLSGLGIKLLKRDIHTTEDSPFEFVSRLSHMADKISFDEYRWNGICPIKKLDEQDLCAMMQTHSFNRERILILANLDDLPDPVRCGLDEEVVLQRLESTNVMGDNSKKLSRRVKIDGLQSSREDIEDDGSSQKTSADWKLQHLNFIWNHSDWFSSPGAKTLDESLAAMSARRKA